MSFFILLGTNENSGGRTIIEIQEKRIISPSARWNFSGFVGSLDEGENVSQSHLKDGLVCPHRTRDRSICLDRQEQRHIGNGVCNVESNKMDCCFDGGDCCTSFSCQPLASNGLHETSKDLFNVGLDQLCPGCDKGNDNVGIADHRCHQNLAPIIACCFDGGDCEQITQSDQSDPNCAQQADMICQDACFEIDQDCKPVEHHNAICPTCPPETNNSLNDGVCSDNLNMDEDDPRCCFDALDCLKCFTCSKPQLVSDIYCDTDLMTQACCLDGGDCKSLVELSSTSSLCPSCHFKKYWRQIADGKCHMELVNHDCCFDGGDCFASNANSLNWCSSCHSKVQGIFYNLYLSNGICEAHYNTPT